MKVYCPPKDSGDYMMTLLKLGVSKRERKRRDLRTKYCSPLRKVVAEKVHGWKDGSAQATLLSVREAKKFLKENPEHKKNFLKCVDIDVLGTAIREGFVNPRSTYTHKGLEEVARCMLERKGTGYSQSNQYASLYMGLKKERES